MATMQALGQRAVVNGALAGKSIAGNRVPCRGTSKAAVSLPTRRSITRCQAGDEQGPLAAVKDTKVPITPESVKQNEQNESEKHSVFGAEPAYAFPRPESQRRPELGNTSFGSVMAFDGPGPETINGRLAMVGALWAFISEIFTGERIVDQINYPGSPGLFFLVIITQIVIWSSLIPISNGESPDSRANGPFNARAERWNGRLAMIGFAGILLNEYLSKHSVFPLTF